MADKTISITFRKCLTGSYKHPNSRSGSRARWNTQESKCRVTLEDVVPDGRGYVREDMLPWSYKMTTFN